MGHLKDVKGLQRVFTQPGECNNSQTGHRSVDQYKRAAQPHSPVNHFLLDGGKNVGVLAHSGSVIGWCNAHRKGRHVVQAAMSYCTNVFFARVRLRLCATAQPRGTAGRQIGLGQARHVFTQTEQLKHAEMQSNFMIAATF